MNRTKNQPSLSDDSRSMKVKGTIVAVVSAALLYMTPYSNAQLAASSARAQTEMQTSLPGVTTRVGPPAGFKALTATDDELAQFGFPPRPDQKASPKAYNTWARAVQVEHRITPEPVQTQIHHKAFDGRQVRNGLYYSSNWSGFGYATNAYNRSYSNAFYYAESEFEVPRARQAFGACTGGWDYSSSWVGIDGFYGSGASDVLQAGIESDAFCLNSYPTEIKFEYYSFWFAWFPGYAYRITNLPIEPGDEVYVEVWSTSPTYGHAYLANFSTGHYAVVDFYAPPGTYLVGNSVEWIVERPELYGRYATLTNYGTEYFSDSYGVTFGNYEYEPGSNGSWEFQMYDDRGYIISDPYLLGDEAIRFRDYNSARDASLP